MTEKNIEPWSCFAKVYDPLKIGSIDGTDIEPHDKGIIRAINSEYKPNKHVKGKPGCTIFVSRLSPKTTKDTIKDIFSRFGRLKRFRLVKDIVTGLPKGYAFIEYESESAAEEAYRKANKMNIDGHTIFVDFECERLLKGWKPRRLGGGFGGRKESGQLRFGCRDRPFRKPICLEIKEHEERLKREKELQAERELEKKERKGRDHSYDRKRNSDGGSKRKHSRSTDRDRKRSQSINRDRKRSRSTNRDRKHSRSTDKDKKRGRSKERQANTEKESGINNDSHPLNATKPDISSEQDNRDEVSKNSESVYKKRQSQSGDRERRPCGSKEKGTNTEKKLSAYDENRQVTKLEKKTTDETATSCKDNLELEKVQDESTSKDKENYEQSSESKFENAVIVNIK